MSKRPRFAYDGSKIVIVPTVSFCESLPKIPKLKSNDQVSSLSSVVNDKELKNTSNVSSVNQVNVSRSTELKNGTQVPDNKLLTNLKEGNNIAAKKVTSAASSSQNIGDVYKKNIKRKNEQNLEEVLNLSTSRKVKPITRLEVNKEISTTQSDYEANTAIRQSNLKVLVNPEETFPGTSLQTGPDFQSNSSPPTINIQRSSFLPIPFPQHPSPSEDINTVEKKHTHESSSIRHPLRSFDRELLHCSGRYKTRDKNTIDDIKKPKYAEETERQKEYVQPNHFIKATRDKHALTTSSRISTSSRHSIHDSVHKLSSHRPTSTSSKSSLTSGKSSQTNLASTSRRSLSGHDVGIRNFKIPKLEAKSARKPDSEKTSIDGNILSSTKKSSIKNNFEMPVKNKSEDTKRKSPLKALKKSLYELKANKKPTKNDRNDKLSLKEKLSHKKVIRITPEEIKQKSSPQVRMKTSYKIKSQQKVESSKIISSSASNSAHAKENSLPQVRMKTSYKIKSQQKVEGSKIISSSVSNSAHAKERSSADKILDKVGKRSSKEMCRKSPMRTMKYVKKEDKVVEVLCDSERKKTIKSVVKSPRKHKVKTTVGIITDLRQKLAHRSLNELFSKKPYKNKYELKRDNLTITVPNAPEIDKEIEVDQNSLNANIDTLMASRNISKDKDVRSMLSAKIKKQSTTTTNSKPVKRLRTKSDKISSSKTKILKSSSEAAKTPGQDNSNLKCKKIKLVINVTYEKPNSSEKSSSSSESEDDNVLSSTDLSFLDDINIDEIVNSLQDLNNNPNLPEHEVHVNPDQKPVIDCERASTMLSDSNIERTIELKSKNYSDELGASSTPNINENGINSCLSPQRIIKTELGENEYVSDIIESTTEEIERNKKDNTSNISDDIRCRIKQELPCDYETLNVIIQEEKNKIESPKRKENDVSPRDENEVSSRDESISMKEITCENTATKLNVPASDDMFMHVNNDIAENNKLVSDNEDNNKMKTIETKAVGENEASSCVILHEVKNEITENNNNLQIDFSDPSTKNVDKNKESKTLAENKADDESPDSFETIQQQIMSSNAAELHEQQLEVGNPKLTQNDISLNTKHREIPDKNNVFMENTTNVSYLPENNVDKNKESEILRQNKESKENDESPDSFKTDQQQIMSSNVKVESNVKVQSTTPTQNNIPLQTKQSETSNKNNIVLDNTEAKQTTKTNTRGHSPIRSPLTAKKSIIVDDTNKTVKVESESLAVPTTLKGVDLFRARKLEDRMLRYLKEEYKVLSVIHKGYFSIIYKCKDAIGRPYAAKVIKLENMRDRLGIQKELILMKLQKDIPRNKLNQIFLYNGFAVQNRWCFLMEFYPKTLKQAMMLYNIPFHIDQVENLSRQLISAVIVLRNNNIVHTDINPSHILLNHAHNRLKLCGFDRSQEVRYLKLNPNVSSNPTYRAPEVIIGHSIGFSIDVWSTGLVMYKMATNQNLFIGHFNNEILYQQMRKLGPIPADMIKDSLFNVEHFLEDTHFIRRLRNFQKVVIPLDTIYNYKYSTVAAVTNAYRTHWESTINDAQKRCNDKFKLFSFHQLLMRMLTLHPRDRMPIEFVYGNPFIHKVNAE